MRSIGCVWLLAAVALLGSCRKTAPARLNRVVAIRAKNPSHLDLPWSEREWQQQILVWWQRAPGLPPLVESAEPSKEVRDWELIVSTEAQEQPSHPFVELVLQRIRPEEDRFIESVTVCEAVNLKTHDAAKEQSHWERCFANGISQLQRKWQLLMAGPEAIVRALMSADSQAVLDALAVAAVAPDRAFVPALSKLLRHREEEIRDRSLGVAVEIGDTRVVHALLEWAKFGNQRELIKIIDALGALGGSEAETFLEFVATGHESEEMRQAARRALQHAHERKVK